MMTGETILITSPSLKVEDNVSGIATLVTNIIKHSRFRINHFVVGSKDKDKKSLLWLINQFASIMKFFGLCLSKRFDVLHINTSMEKLSIFRDCVFVSIAGLFKKKILLHVHGGYYLMHFPTNRLLAFCMKRLFSHANIIAVLSERERDLLVKRFGELNFKVLPNAVDYDFDNEDVNHLSKFETQRTRLTFFGRINTSKGIHVISECFQYLGNYCKDLQLDIYGAGPELNRWMLELQKVNDLQVDYRGVVSRDLKWKALQNTDVFLLPSIHSEGLPIAMLEAMAVGSVVLVTDDASITTVIENNVNGIVVPKNSASALAEKIKDILNGSINVQTIGRNAREYVRRHLSFPQYIARLDNLYHEI